MIVKKLRKTYGVRGLLEWKMTLRAGKAMVRIDFTGGSMGGNGVIGAKYATDSRALQKLIETSEHFARGKVYLYGRPEEVGEEYVPDTNVPEGNIGRDDNPETANCHEDKSRRADSEDSDPVRGDDYV